MKKFHDMAERGSTKSKMSRVSRVPSQIEDSLANTGKTKKLKDIILDTDDEERYQKYVRLTEDNINDLEHKLVYTFKNYAITRKDSGDAFIEDDEYYIRTNMIKDAEGIMRDKSELKLKKKQEKLALLKKLKAEIKKKKKEERHNKLFENPKWWMYLMKNPEKVLKKRKMKKIDKKSELEGWKNVKKAPEKPKINIYKFLDKRSKRKQKMREDKAMSCIDFWKNLKQERKDLIKMMLAVQLKKFMLKTKRKEKERKILEKTPRQTLSVILINVSYLERKREQCIRLIKKNFKNIIGATDEEVKILKTKLNEVKYLFRKRSNWNHEHLISLMTLSKKVFNVAKHKNSIKEEQIDYYVDALYTMMDVQKKVAQDVKVSTIRSPKIYNKIYKIMKETEIFISEQLLVLKYIRNVLLHAEWTYLYYARMRVIRRVDEAIKKIMCNGYRLRPQRTESDLSSEIICDEPEFNEQYIKDNPMFGRMINTKEFCPISNHSIF